jgi:predicted nucleic acid-binding protein
MISTSGRLAGPVVLDTNVVSELMRRAPADAVLAWVGRQEPAAVCTTAVTVAEVKYGIARLPSGRRKTQLEAATAEVFEAFADRVLPFDVAAADLYAQLVVERERAGTPITGVDAQIAAICRQHGAVLATPNTADFVGLGLSLTDPWVSGG